MKFSDIPQFTKNGNWECDFGLKEFVRQIEEWEAEDKLNLQPDFQREHVWTREQQIAFIEYLLKGGKSGRTIYLNNPTWNSQNDNLNYKDFVCVDGLQRTTAIRKFINNEIKVFGYYFKEYEDKPRITVSKMKVNVNDLQTKKEVLNWYLEMNSGGTPHTEEELNKVKKMLDEEDK